MKRISNSEVQAFKDCRRRWYLQYVRRLKLRREDPTGARSIGTRVHAVLEDYYQPHEPGYDLFDSLALHDAIVAADLEDFPEQADKIRKEGDLSRAMCEGYFQWLEDEGADEGLRVIAAEEALEVELVPGVIFQGKMDIQVEREVDGAVLVLDHKTVQEFTTPTRTLHLDEQMKSYVMLKRLLDPSARVDGAIYNMIRKVKRTAAAKPPFFSRFEVRHNNNVLNEFYGRLLAEVAEIQRVEEEIRAGNTALAFPRPTRDCSWKCDFYGICPLVDDDSTNVEGLIEALYEEGDPYRRYERDTGV